MKYPEDINLDDSKLGEDMLWKCLSLIITRSRGVIFQFIVDAIYTFDPILETNGAPLLGRLERLLAADVCGHMRLLITERKVPDEKLLGQDSTSIINMKNETTRQAVQEYIHAQVRGHLLNTRSNPLVGAQVEDEIINISSGNFLMASLTWKWFSNEAQIWIGDANQFPPLKQVYNLPHDLETFYCGLLNMLPLKGREEVRRAFAILRISFERLSSQQLSLFATVWKFDCSTSSFDPRAVEDERSQFETYLHQCCSYFVRKNEDGLVGFTHQTTKDLFSSQLQLTKNARALNQYAMSQSDAHSILSLMCMKVLQAESILITNDEIECILSRSAKEVNELGVPSVKQYDMKMPNFKSKIQKRSETSCLLYALMNWSEHYTKATPSMHLDLQVAQFLRSDHGLKSYMLWAKMTKIHDLLDLEHQYSEMAESMSFPLLNDVNFRYLSGRLRC